MGLEGDLASLAAGIGLSEEQARAVTQWVQRSLASATPTVHLPEGTETLHPDADPVSRPAPVVPTVADRYDDLGLIGIGGMGEVRRVRDRHLNRALAMKVIRAEFVAHTEVSARFVEEAHVAAQLQHPGVVPVHEIGRLPDGRLFFTMKEVRGRTFGDVIKELHHPEPSEWTLRRVIDAFVKVAEAMGYAHARGVIHRDLKPDNVMIGAFGEVLVLDWGLAKVIGEEDRSAADLDPAWFESGGTVVTTLDHTSATRIGTVAGTAAYMPIEQARGEVARLDARSDVYALGAILYEILAGRRPYVGKGLLAQLLAGPPDPLPDGLPPELAALCTRAMAREQADRFPDAGHVAAEARAWLDGARRREQALAVLRQAAETGPAAQRLRDEAAALRAEAAQVLAGVGSWEPEDRKRAGWALEDRATALEAEVRRLALQEEALLRGALTHDPQLPEAHAALAARCREEHARAEARRDADEAGRAELRLREHLAALPAEHPERRRATAWLAGTGALTVVTDPAGAAVELYRYEVHDRRLVAVPAGHLGTTPLRAVRLEMGSYLCVIRHPDRPAVRYPVHIARGEHWDGVAPGESSPRPIALPRDLGPDERYVPAGWFAAGDPAGERVWCDALVVQRFPATNAQFLAFLDDLVATGREAEALAAAPRERSGTGDDGALLYGRDERGRFFLRPDAEGDLWEPQWPVIMLAWSGAAAYARWLAEKTGLPWRLPVELEWEKAARGVDGRSYPWGDGFDPSWCNMRDSRPGKPYPAPVDSFPVDESVYGVRGMGGNVQDWCADRGFDPKEPPAVADRRVVVAPLDPDPAARRPSRGGFWFGTGAWSRCGYRYGLAGSYRNSNLGVRPFRSVG